MITYKQTVAGFPTSWQISEPANAGKQVSRAEEQPVKGISAKMHM